MFKKPGPCKSTSQTRHCVSKYPFSELSWGMVREDCVFKKPGPCKITSQTCHCVSKYPFGELSLGMVREKTVCLRNIHAKVALRLAIVSVSIPLVNYPGVWLGRRQCV